MYLEIFLISLFIGFLFLLLGITRKPYFLVFAGLVFLLTGLLVAFDGGILIATGETVSIASNTSIANYTVTTGSYTYEYTSINHALVQMIYFILILLGAGLTAIAGYEYNQEHKS